MQSRRLCRARGETSWQLLWSFPNRGDLQDRTALVILILSQISSLPQSLVWTKLFQEKTGWRRGKEEEEVLMEGMARHVLMQSFSNICLFPPIRAGVVEGIVVATSLLWPGFRQPLQRFNASIEVQKPVAAWLVRCHSF